MNPSRPRTIHGFRPMAILLVAAVSGAISAPSASLAARPPGGTPSMSINDVTLTEGDAGTLTLTFTVTQSARAKTSVRFATDADTASSPADFLARSGTLRFAGGNKKKQVAVTVVGDMLDEANETFFVRLSNPVGATIADGQGVGTITDNDAPPTVSSVATLTVPEGESGRPAGRLGRRHPVCAEREARLRRLHHGRRVRHSWQRLRPERRDARLRSRPDDGVGRRHGLRATKMPRAMRPSTSIWPTR